MINPAAKTTSFRQPVCAQVVMVFAMLSRLLFHDGTTPFCLPGTKNATLPNSLKNNSYLDLEVLYIDKNNSFK